MTTARDPRAFLLDYAAKGLLTCWPEFLKSK